MLCVFHTERTSEGQATYRRCFSIPVESILLLLGSSNKGIVVYHSPISTVAPQQVRPSPTFTVAPRQVHRSPIFCVALIDTVASSTSAPFTNLQCYAFYKDCYNLQCCAFYECCTHRHCYASTVALFYGVAPFISCYFVPCDYGTR